MSRAKKVLTLCALGAFVALLIGVGSSRPRPVFAPTPAMRAVFSYQGEPTRIEVFHVRVSEGQPLDGLVRHLKPEDGWRQVSTVLSFGGTGDAAYQRGPIRVAVFRGEYAGDRQPIGKDAMGPGTKPEVWFVPSRDNAVVYVETHVGKSAVNTVLRRLGLVR